MSKKVISFFVLTMLTSIILKAEWIPLNKEMRTKTPPKVTLINDDQQGAVIRIDLSGVELKDMVADGRTYQVLDLLTETFTSEPGKPEIPYISTMLAIPDQASVNIEVIATGEVMYIKDIDLVPARASWFEGEVEPPYILNQDAYRSDDAYPLEDVATDPPVVFRDFRLSRVSVFPVRYFSGKKELQITSSLTVKVTYGQGKTVNPRTAANKNIAPSFGKLYRSSVLNYQEVLNRLYGGREEGRDLILCIMPEEFAESFQVYADWKRQSGTDVHVTTLTDIGGGTNNPDLVKAYIADAYHNWEIPPTYVLIVGDDGVFPKKIVTYPDYSFPNEDFFVEIDGNDYFPEMMIGRFTNQGDYRMQVMINKFMLYEKQPSTVDPAWFKKGTVCSNNMYESQKDTKRFAASMMRFGGFTSVDTLMSDGSGWGGDCSVDLQDVLNAINNGRSFLNYRGEGWTDGWQATCYSFSTSDVSGLTNGEKFTFVTSIGCGVAMFDTWGANNCFGEEWVELGTLTAPRGGVAFVGPTSNTHTTYNNKIDRGIYTGMFTEGMDTPGQALLRGKLYMYNVFGDEYYTEYHYKIYCILGDPSIHIWKDIPLPVDVSHPASILVGPRQVDISVNFVANGNPVTNAEVCLAGEEIFATAITDMNGIAHLEFTPTLPDTIIVTVRGGNVYPYQGEMIVIQPAELVMPVGSPQVTDLDGNLDGLVNPNENCQVTYTLKNWGSQTANNVMALLTSTDDENIQVITTNGVSFGNLAPGATSSGSPFQVYIFPNCPVGELIPLQLHVVSEDEGWDYNNEMEVEGCRLEEFSFMVNDAGSPDPNYRMDPGETVLLFVSVKNNGNDVAPDVLGTLRSDDPYITIIDSVGTYGTINIDEIGLNTSNYYIVSVDPSCPVNYLAEYSLKLKTFNGNYPYNNLSVFTIPVSKPIPSDYTGPDAYGYYGYSSDDYFDQAPDYSWYEIDQAGSQINMAGIGDYTETVNLPFAFKYYGIDYNQLRISTDGWVAFGSGNQTASFNAQLPHVDNINCMVAGFWDDLWDDETVEGNIYYYHDIANHRFIIEWDSIARNDFGSEPNVEIFQIVLNDPAFYPTPTGDGEIIIQYRQVMATFFCTVGIENHTQDLGLQYLCNNNYNPTASTLKNQFAIKFTTEPPFASLITGTGGNQQVQENGFKLEQNRPNPFIHETWINYSIPVSCQVSLNIYSADGTLIRRIQNGTQAAGAYTVSWNGMNDGGSRVAPGIYFYELKTDQYRESRKMFIVR